MTLLLPPTKPPAEPCWPVRRPCSPTVTLPVAQVNDPPATQSEAFVVATGAIAPKIFPAPGGSTKLLRATRLLFLPPCPALRLTSPFWPDHRAAILDDAHET